jgi:hypothetical protein
MQAGRSLYQARKQVMNSPHFMLKTALQYVAKSWFIFPITPRQKKPPLVKWRQESSNDPEKITQWWLRWPDANIGLDCGKSDLIVIDVDIRDCGLQHWVDLCDEHGISQATLTVGTPNGGWHVYYKAPKSQIGNSSALSHLGIDVRGYGGYVLLPPSQLENGKSYMVENEADIISMPEALAKILETKSKPPIATDSESQIIPKGQRDTTLTSLAGSMRKRGMSTEAIEAALLTENASRCQPPLEEKQVKKIAESIGNKAPGELTLNKQERKTKDSEVQSAKLVNCASRSTLFHDQYGEPFAFIDGETVPLSSKNFRRWLTGQFYQAESRAPGTEALNQALMALEARAVFQGREIVLHNRIAEQDGSYWYDLGNDKAIKVLPGGWEIVDAPILFRRYSHQKIQATPTPGGDPFEVFRFLNVNNDQQLLVLACIISYFVPDIPHPIFHPHGPHGSGKTSSCVVIKRLCDPSSIEALISPKNPIQLIQTLAHHHVCLFDNMSHLPDWMSDILCQACTGGGFSKRQLYTDDDDVIYQIKRCVGLNGINLLTVKSDIMDRSILLHLERIDGNRRMEEAEMWAAFEEAKPGILGGIFDTLSKAMARYPNIRLHHLPRMADFARQGVAIAEALGFSGDDFLHAYQINVDSQNEEVVQSNTLAQAVLSLMSDRGSWDGMVKQAHDKLHDIADPDKKDPTFPKNNRTLRKHLERIKPNLADYGITYTIGKRTSDGYPIVFQKDENFGSFGSFDTQALPDKDLAGEPRVNQNEANRQPALFDSSPNPLKDNVHEPNEANEANLQALGERPATPSRKFDNSPPALREEVEERAAIMQFDGGLSREEAEMKALILAGEPT